MSIKLITFDLDDTLWDTAPVIASAEVVLRDWLEANAPILGGVPVEHLFAIRERLVQAEPGLKHRISALRRRVLFHALEEVGYSEKHAQELANEGFEVFLHARHQVEIFPEVQPVLEILRHHYTLGVVTNGNADVSRLGLADYFRFALCAEDLGIGKPDPAPFLEALRRGDVEASAAVHIGDHPGDDIAGAQRAVAEVPGATLERIPTEQLTVLAGREAGSVLVAREQRPDAVFAANDLLAVGVMQAVVMIAGLRIPDDIALIGYDDIDFATSTIVPLSSVRQPARLIGSQALELLEALVEDPTRAPSTVEFEPELVVRASTAG